MNRSFFFLLLVFSTNYLAVNGQQLYHFKNALAAPIPNNYGREAIYTDQLAYELYAKTLRKPQKNVSWGTGSRGEEIVWQELHADSANRLFRRGGGRSFGRAGYMYLTYQSDKKRVALLNIRGNSGLYFNGVPHAGDPYNSGWMYIPVEIKKGLNELYVRANMITASLSFPAESVMLNTEDLTLPSIVLSHDNDSLQGAVVVINTSTKRLSGLSIKSLLNGREKISKVPDIPAMSSRKIPFVFDGSNINTAGDHQCQLMLFNGSRLISESSISLSAVTESEKYSISFISEIDGSLQYYAVAPKTSGPKQGSALFLSVHGAGVEAIGQARAYESKDWGDLIAPTNRRPRGFNWEDWGRLDAMEVLNLARERFKPDPKKIYLTGHSMGGHGTWFLGATYPDKWAAIAPCAGYPTLKGYGSADGLVPDSSANPMEQMLLKAGNQSDMIKLSSNYKPLGVYIFHGDDDRTVSVNYARQMRAILGNFHTDMSYYEYPGGSHWFGNESVDWQPIFDFFKWHLRKDDSLVNYIDFKTASPGISSSYYWAGIYQQLSPLAYSRMILQRNFNKQSIEGSTENIRLLKFDLTGFTPGTEVKIILDSLETLPYRVKGRSDTIFLRRDKNKWSIDSKPERTEKGPHRYGTFKEAFNHRKVFVYGTTGSREENEWAYHKARYDAETWYYRGNGAVDIISDKEFMAAPLKDRGIILFGNKSTNAAWNYLLEDSPIQVDRNIIKAGARQWSGDDLSAYFVWPDRRSDFALIGVISGTGMKGMNAANANQYFAGASGFPDFMIYSMEMLKTGVDGLKMAGFFDYAWQLVEKEMITND